MGGPVAVRQRGLALVAVVAALIALVLIAIPFAVQMTNAKRRAESRIAEVRVGIEAENAFDLAILWLRHPGDLTLTEFLAANPAPAGVLRDVRIEREAGKVDVSTASAGLLGNLLGGTRLAEDLEEDATAIVVADGSALAEAGGVVRVGGEVCRYRERIGNRLLGVDRGVGAADPWQVGPRRWAAGTAVAPEAAFLAATRPLRVEPGRYTPYTNLYEVRRISDLGPAALDADELGALSHLLTTRSAAPGAGEFTNPQTLRSALPSGEDDTRGERLLLEDPSYFGPGTVVRIEGGGHREFGVVLTNDGTTVTLVNRVESEYAPDETVVTGLVRHPVDVNLASEETLAACLAHVALRGKESAGVDPEAARELANRLKAAPRHHLFEVEAVFDAAARDGTITQSQRDALYRNALNPNDARLAFSTAPLRFEDGPAATVTATAVISSKAGEELARRSFRRLMSAPAAGRSTFEIASQEEFEDPIIATRDAKWMMTFPFNTGCDPFDFANPSSRFRAHVGRNIWPSRDRGDGVGDVRLRPERIDLTEVFHFDDSWYADGEYVHKEPLEWSTRDRRIDLVDRDGMGPLSVGFWIKPYWGGRRRTEYLLDCAASADANRASVIFDASRSELVLRVQDTAGDGHAAEVRHPVTPETFADDVWYRVTAEAKGTKPGDLTLMLDGRAVGRSSCLTHLTRAIEPTPYVNFYESGALPEFVVEDTSTFPESGVLLVRGTQGTEGFSYSGKTDRTFRITARNVRSDVSSYTIGTTFGQSHPEGSPVELLGYASPLVTDVLAGNAKLTAHLGEYHVLRVIFDDDVLYVPSPLADAGDSSGDAEGPAPPAPPADDDGAVGDGPGDHGGAPGSYELRGIAADRDIVDLVLGEDIVSYVPNLPDEESLAAFGPRGFALLLSPGNDQNLVKGQIVGGSEIVYYEKHSLGLIIQRYRRTKQIDVSNPYFVPADSVGNPKGSIALKDMSGQARGAVTTVLVPISLEVTGDPEGYYDTTEEDHLSGAWAVVDEEWIAYTYPDADTTGSSVLLVWDHPDYVGWIMRMWKNATYGVYRPGAGLATPPVDPGDAEPTDPVPPDHEPGPPGDAEPPPTPGGEDDVTAPGGGGPPPPPLPPSPGGEDDATAPVDGGLPPAPSPADEPEPGGEDDATAPGDPAAPDDALPPPPGGEDDSGPTGGETAPPEPPLPPDSGGAPETPPDEDPDEGDDAEPADADPEPRDPGPGTPERPVGQGPARGMVEWFGGHRTNASGYDYSPAPTHAAGSIARNPFVSAGHGAFLPGPGDRVTVANADRAVGALRVGRIAYDSWRFLVDLPPPATKLWVVPEEPPSAREAATIGELPGILAGTVDTRRLARLLKFPSGELPAKTGDTIRIAGDAAGGRISPAFVDEVWFRRERSSRIWYAGDGRVARMLFDRLFRVTHDAPPEPGLTDADAKEIPLHDWPTTSRRSGLPVNDLPEGGGVARIGEELIVFASVDTTRGRLLGCRRGAFGTEPTPHAFGERVTLLDAATVAFLTEDLSIGGDRIAVDRPERFPESGWLRIGNEIVGYSERSADALRMPSVRSGEDGASGGLLRGRFGTRASAWPRGEPVFFFPVRHPDRYFEGADHPEASALILRKEIPGALFTRIAWDEHAPELLRLHVTARFDGTPAWGSEEVFDVGSGRPASGDREAWRENPKRYLYRLDDPHGANRLGIQADLVEVRVEFEFLKDAHEWGADPPPDSWKLSPWLKSLRIEYAAPVTAHYSEDRR